MPVPSGVRLNEVLSNPRSINWDARGQANAQDEWIEIHNPTDRPVNLARWTIEVPGARQSQVYRLGRAAVIPAKGFLLLFQRDTRLVLDDQGGTIRLVDATGKLYDVVRYPALPPDQSYSRDAQGVWHANWPPSPGKPNAAVLPQGQGTVTPMPTANS